MVCDQVFSKPPAKLKIRAVGGWRLYNVKHSNQQESGMA